ncbi:MAG: PQQ-binding-like beta-propeller repeat protein [Pirellulaceae bacterium]
MNKNLTDTAPDPPDPQPNVHETEPGRPMGRRFVGLWIALGFVVLSGVSQLAGPFSDHQWSNIVSFACTVVAIAFLLVWWVNYFRHRPFVRIAPMILLGLCIATFLVLFEYDGVSGELEPSFSWRFDTEERELPTLTTQQRAVEIDAPVTTKFSGFLGNQRDGTIQRREFATDWTSDPPVLLFRQPIGAGWSGFAIAGDYGYTLEQREGEEWTTCYHLDSGELIWKHVETARHENALGGVGPRSTPSLVDEHVVVQGGTGIVLCLRATDGKLIWRQDLLQLSGIDQVVSEEIAPWGRSGSPLIVDGTVVVPFGGVNPDVSALAAFDLADGKLRWKTFRPGTAEDASQAAKLGQSQISYASPIVASIAGRRQILSVNESDVSGYDISTGETLWTQDWPGSTNAGANCSQPVPIDENRILVSKAYGGGGMLFEVVKKDGGFEAKTLWRITNLLKTKFSNLVVKQGFAYGLSDGILECVEIETGLRQWRQPRSGRYKHGQLLMVEDVLLVLAEDGRVALVAAQSESFEELASIEAIVGKTWSNPAVAGRRLVVRNADQAASFLLPARGENE